MWRGALLLADYILFRRDLFQGRTVLELGAGTGLASIVAATVARTVYCTGNKALAQAGRRASSQLVLTRLGTEAETPGMGCCYSPGLLSNEWPSNAQRVATVSPSRHHTVGVSVSSPFSADTKKEQISQGTMRIFPLVGLKNRLTFVPDHRCLAYLLGSS